MAKPNPSTVEILEARIAPAAITLPGLPTVKEANWKTATSGQSLSSGQAVIELNAGDGLSTGGDKSGAYLMFVEKGNCLVFATDYNNNNKIDPNEITGIAAGNGLRLISFVEIHGDIVTNLKETPNGLGGVKLTLSDSDNNPSNDTEANGAFRGDGRVLLNNTIEKIEFRSLEIGDIPDQNGDGVVTGADVAARSVASTYSLYGNIYAGRGFGVLGDPTSGYFVDAGGADDVPLINGIKVGSSASGGYYSFGVSARNDFQGTLQKFVAPRGQVGAHIAGVHTAEGTALSINYLLAGNGGVGAAGGNIQDVQIASDSVGGYYVIAGNGGSGPTGGGGGAILNFSDSGSITGQVVIRSGDGGSGSTGAGGSASQVLLGPLNLIGNVVLELGDGGSGFTAGGAGASLTAGTIVTPDATVATGLNAYGVTRSPIVDGLYVPVIGMHQALDFNGDGFGDIVFTTGTRSQVVIALGDGLGGFLEVPTPYSESTDRAIFLPGLGEADALTIADFNNDGHPDIAVASTVADQGGAIAVYFSKYGPQGDFLGFDDARFGLIHDTFYGIPETVNKLAAGDFNGDGIMEIAAQATWNLPTGRFQGIVFLSQDVENNAPTGQFFVDFGTPIATPLEQQVLKTPTLLYFAGSGDQVEIQATALSPLSTHDTLVYMRRGGPAGSGLTNLDYGVPDPLFGFPEPVYSQNPSGFWDPGQVDTNRALAGENPVNLVNYTMQNFTIGNFDNDVDGVADIAVLSLAPQNFLQIISGTLTPFILDPESPPVFSFAGIPHSETSTGNNSGIVLAVGMGSRAVHITSGDFDTFTTDLFNGYEIDDLAFAVITPGLGDAVYAFGYNYTTLPAVQKTLTLLDLGGTSDFRNEPSIPFTVYHPLIDDPFGTPAVGAGTDIFGMQFGLDATTAILDELGQPLFSTFILTSFIDYQVDAYTIHAGDGGKSLTGKGGNGGSLGSTLTLVEVTDPFTGEITRSFLGTLTFVLDMPLTLIAGKGADGFSGGGIGGNISGVTVEQTDAYIFWNATTLIAGNGGRGFAGNGGNGGSIFDNFIDDGELYQAGDGGSGKIGGNGGSIVGNGQRGTFRTGTGHGGVPIEGFYDSASFFMEITAGKGGLGTKRGGNGGDITDFGAALLPGASLIYTAGAGGDSVAGPGGRGGNIVGSSPLLSNFGDGDVILVGGAGGSGTIGGDGGRIENYIHTLDSAVETVNVVSILGGHGGNGLSGNGGKGGSVSGVTVATSGLANQFLAGFAFNRIMSGNGGASSAGKGGVGGDVFNINTSSQQVGYAIVAGSGGDGLLAGGVGGNVLNLTLEGGGGPLANNLIAAGAGGNASAFIPNALDPRLQQAEKAFGGKIGVGGNGGNINGVNGGNNALAHYNLIAGDGGSTITYGTPNDPKSYVGRGGSVMNIRMEKNDIGNMDGDDPATPTIPSEIPGEPPTGFEAVPIKSYNDTLGGESFRSWVSTHLRPDEEPLELVTLTDLDGNVGIIVGAAGRNKSVAVPGQPGVFVSLPSTGSKNGDLINVIAKNIMSAVAGSVDRIAAINLAKNIQVPAPLGAEKNIFGAPDTESYILEDGTMSAEPGIDGRLIDGAIIAHAFKSASGASVTLPGKVFVL